MKKILAVLMVAVFAVSNPVFAASVALSDKEMDNVAAGDWQVITDSAGNESVVSELYYSSNDIKLSEDSQKDIQAVSNANVVDSAVAVQTNIASVTGAEPINNNVSGSNTANLTNYNPSEETSSFSFGSTSSSSSSSYDAAFGLTKSLDISKTHNDWDLETTTFDLVETLDINAASASSSEEDCKGCEKSSASASTFVLDYDKTIDYDKNVNKGSNDAFVLAADLTITKTESLDVSSTTTSTTKTGSFSRKNLSENNHIKLEDASQSNIQAVSNLNSVGSSVAVQTNIATNVGVAGTITHTNVATAVNGL